MTSTQANNTLWEIQRIARCIDLSFAFSGEAKAKIIEAEECMAEAEGHAHRATIVHTDERRAEEIAAALKDAHHAEEALQEALSVISEYYPDGGVVANLRAGRRAIIALHNQINGSGF